MTCRWRYLTADGRVLVCEGHAPDAHPTLDPHGTSDHADPEWSHLDPCAWEAPVCLDCGGEGGFLTEPDINFGEPCDDCGGTGVDERIPPHLVGVGSTLRDLTGEDQGEFVIARFERGGFAYHPESGGKCWAALSEVGDSMELVRAVPPAHEEDAS